LDELGDRNALLTIMPEVLAKANSKSKARDENQTDLFSMLAEEDQPKISFQKTPLPEVDPVKDSDKIRWEKELLGIFVSTHPLQKFFWTKIFPDYEKLRSVEEFDHNRNLKVLCTITS